MQSTIYDKRWYREQIAAYPRERTYEYQAATFIAYRCNVAVSGDQTRWLKCLTATEVTATFLVCDLGDMLSSQTPAGDSL